MSACIHSVRAVLCVCGGLAPGRSPVQGDQSTVHGIKKLNKVAKTQQMERRATDTDNYNNKCMIECRRGSAALTTRHPSIHKS
jgi:hypothetical protein